MSGAKGGLLVKWCLIEVDHVFQHSRLSLNEVICINPLIVTGHITTVEGRILLMEG
jgi:hypothetical protein